VPEYRVALKSSAEKEFFRLPDHIAARILPKIKALATDPRPRGSKSSEAARTNGGYASVITAWSTSLMTKWREWK
jgi:mRNA-degrading endonuclease RelE of RelBE toxin-antitoxin system